MPRPFAEVIKPADFACLPIAGDIGKLVELGQYLNGDGFAPYEHALLYAGYFDHTPTDHPDCPPEPPVTGEGEGHWVIEAHPDGARLRKLPCHPVEIHGSLWSAASAQITPQVRELIIGFAFQYLKTPYSALDYFALSAHRLKLHPLDNMLKDRIASSGHMICSQYVDRMYGLSGIELFHDGRWPGYVTPLDLAHLIS